MVESSWRSRDDFRELELVYAEDLNSLSYDIRNWGGDVHAHGHVIHHVTGIDSWERRFPHEEAGIYFPLAINGNPLVLNSWSKGFVAIGKDFPKHALDVEGDVNCTGTFRVNGVPIMAFRQAAPEIRYVGVKSCNNITGDINIVAGSNVEIRHRGSDIVINAVTKAATVNELSVTLEAGDNINLVKSENKIIINSDPGDWGLYLPEITDKNGKVESVKTSGQYIIYGPMCTVQIHVLVEQQIKGPIKVSLPVPTHGPVRQCLAVYTGSNCRIFNVSIQGLNIVFSIEKETSGEFLISGSYRIA